MSSRNTPRSGKTADPTRKCEKAADKNGRAMRSSSRIALIRSICEEKPCKCSACSKAFISAACLSKHMQLHKAKDTKRRSQVVRLQDRENHFTCEVCDKPLRTATILTQHMKIHTGENRFECSTCSSTFSNKQAFKRHYKIHPVVPLPCAVCEKSFDTEPSLERHKRTHKTQKVFMCEVCHKRYKTQGHFRRHKGMSKHKPEMVQKRHRMDEYTVPQDLGQGGQVQQTPERLSGEVWIPTTPSKYFGDKDQQEAHLRHQHNQRLEQQKTHDLRDQFKYVPQIGSGPQAWHINNLNIHEALEEQQSHINRIEKMKKREELLENLETKVEDIEEEKSIMKQEGKYEDAYMKALHGQGGEPQGGREGKGRGDQTKKNTENEQNNYIFDLQ